MRIGLLTVRNVASKPIRLAQYINMALQPHTEVRHLGAASAARATRGGRLRLAIGKKLKGDRYTLELERKYAEAASVDFKRDPVDIVLGVFTSNIIPYFDVPENVPSSSSGDAGGWYCRSTSSEGISSKMMGTLARSAVRSG